jgi:transposase
VRDGPLEVLKDYRGYAQADAGKGYDALFGPGGATEVGCRAHGRRYFVKAADSDPASSAEALRRIGELYAVEKAAREQELQPDAIRVLRQERAAPLLAAFGEWLEVTKGQVLDKSPMGQAIRYAQAQWEALQRYVEDGRLEMDNNRSERAVVCGRKNWMTLGNEGGGRTAAILYSLVQTCKAAGIDARTYLRDVLIRLREGADPRELTPHRWQAGYAAEVQATRDWVLAQIRGQAR